MFDENNVVFEWYKYVSEVLHGHGCCRDIQRLRVMGQSELFGLYYSDCRKPWKDILLEKDKSYRH